MPTTSAGFGGDRVADEARSGGRALYVQLLAVSPEFQTTPSLGHATRSFAYMAFILGMESMHLLVLVQVT